MGALQRVVEIVGSAFMAAVVALAVMKLCSHPNGWPAVSLSLAYTVLMAVVLLMPGHLSKGYTPFLPVVRRVARRLLRLHAVCLVLLLAGWAADRMVRRGDAWPGMVRDHHEVAAFVFLFGLAWVEFVLAVRMLDASQRDLSLGKSLA